MPWPGIGPMSPTPLMGEPREQWVCRGHGVAFGCRSPAGDGRRERVGSWSWTSRLFW